ncbi:MAG: flavin reductase family protein [Clostridia bacterium]|nr:flavin reductase family protein [Clostridia bacterium]
MEGFRRISAVELGNALKLIGDDWMLITVKDEEGGRANAMTASWGALGVLWHKDVCICYVRPQRHTHKLLREQQRFSVAFMPEEYRDALKLCGTKSGRDTDKLSESGLHTVELDGVPMVKEASILLVCKKLYEDEIKEECFLESEVMATYKAKDYHTFYICEIEEVYERI